MNLIDARDFLDKLEKEIPVKCQATFRLFRAAPENILSVPVYLIVGVTAVIQIDDERPHMFGITELVRDIDDDVSLNHLIHTIAAKFMDGLRKQPQDVLDQLSKGKGPTGP